MTYDEFVEFIKEDGCRVYVYDKKDSIYGGNRGTFTSNEHGPIICVANKGVTAPKRVETLIHEYAHFLQWKEGFMEMLDGIVDSYALVDDWVEGRIELTARELEIARRAVLTMEYDAEKRAYELGNSMDIDDWKPDLYLRGAASYMDVIKWEFLTRSWSTYIPNRSSYKAKILTWKELYAPMSEKKIRKFQRNTNLKTLSLCR